MDNNIQHSIDFITSKTGGKSGFSVPKNYFNGIEDNVFANISEENLPKKKSFDVPTNYFENLEDTILAKIASEEKSTSIKQVKVISLYNRVRRIIPYASVASILLFVSLYFFNNYKTTVTIDDITVSDIENWYDNSYETINSEEIAMVLTDDDLNETDFITTTNDTDLEIYLQNIDPVLLNDNTIK